MHKTFAFILVLTLYSQFAVANDSSLLQRRIDRIKYLAKDLSLLPRPDFNSISDTGKIFSLYRCIDEKYFIHTSEVTRCTRSVGLFDFHYFIVSLIPDSMILRTPDPAKDSITDAKQLPNYLSNTVIIYLPMYGMEWEGFYFAFQEGSDQILCIITAGGSPAEYRKKKEFIDKLKGPAQVGQKASGNK